MTELQGNVVGENLIALIPWQFTWTKCPWKMSEMWIEVLFKNVPPYLTSGQSVGQILPKAITAALTIKCLGEWDKMSPFFLWFDLTPYFIMAFCMGLCSFIHVKCCLTLREESWVLQTLTQCQQFLQPCGSCQPGLTLVLALSLLFVVCFSLCNCHTLALQQYQTRRMLFCWCW